MTHLVKIGNSQGIRIPKPFIEQAQLQNCELELRLVNNGLLVSPKKKPREGWKNSIETTLLNFAAKEVDTEWLDSSLTEDDEIEW